MSELYQRKCTKPSEVSFFMEDLFLLAVKWASFYVEDIQILKPLFFFSEILGVVVVNKRRCKLAETWMYVYSEIKLWY